MEETKNTGAWLQMRRELAQAWHGPKSICACGHPGDETPNAHIRAVTTELISTHAGVLGHGFCIHAKCTCKQFTWAEWTPDFKRALAALEQKEQPTNGNA